VEFEGGWRRKGGALVRLFLRSGFEGFLSQGMRLDFRRSWTCTGSRFDKAETLLCCCAALVVLAWVFPARILGSWGSRTIAVEAEFLGGNVCVMVAKEG
jgi:hypothetical protein